MAIIVVFVCVLFSAAWVQPTSLQHQNGRSQCNYEILYKLVEVREKCEQAERNLDQQITELSMKMDSKWDNPDDHSNALNDLSDRIERKIDDLIQRKMEEIGEKIDRKLNTFVRSLEEINETIINLPALMSCINGQNDSVSEGNADQDVTTTGPTEGNTTADGNTMGRIEIHDEQKTWAEAREFCKQRGMNLVSIGSEEDRQHVVQEIKAAGDPCAEGFVYWTSANRKQGSWHWGDSNHRVADWIWVSGEPDGDSDCAGITSGSMRFYDVICSGARCFICED